MLEAGGSGPEEARGDPGEGSSFRLLTTEQLLLAKFSAEIGRWADVAVLLLELKLRSLLPLAAAIKVEPIRLALGMRRQSLLQYLVTGATSTVSMPSGAPVVATEAPRALRTLCGCAAGSPPLNVALPLCGCLRLPLFVRGVKVSVVEVEPLFRFDVWDRVLLVGVGLLVLNATLTWRLRFEGSVTRRFLISSFMLRRRQRHHT